MEKEMENNINNNENQDEDFEDLNDDDNYYWIFDKDSIDKISNLSIKNVYDVTDRSNRPLILSTLKYDDCKFFIESTLLRVVNIDPSKNKIFIELDEISEKVFTKVDNICVDLLGELLESDENNRLANTVLNVGSELNFNSIAKDYNEKYISNEVNAKSVDVNKKFMKLSVDSSTIITQNKKRININSIKPNDIIRFLVCVESINLYPEELVCFVRTYCHLIEVFRNTNNEIEEITNRKPVEKYDFHSNTDTVFKKTVLNDQDISFAKTEVEIKSVNEDDDSDSNSDSDSNLDESLESENKPIVLDIKESSDDLSSTSSSESVNKEDLNKIAKGGRGRGRGRGRGKSTKTTIINTNNHTESNESNEPNEPTKQVDSTVSRGRGRGRGSGRGRGK